MKVTTYVPDGVLGFNKVSEEIIDENIENIQILAEKKVKDSD